MTEEVYFYNGNSELTKLTLLANKVQIFHEIISEKPRIAFEADMVRGLIIEMQAIDFFHLKDLYTSSNNNEVDDIRKNIEKIMKLFIFFDDKYDRIVFRLETSYITALDWDLEYAIDFLETLLADYD